MQKAMNKTELEQAKTCGKQSLEPAERRSPEPAEGGTVGEIPENWNIKKLSEFCDILMGQSPPSSTYNLNKKGLPFFQGRKDFGEKYPQKMIWCSEPTRMANDGDVLLSVRAPVGDVNVAIEKCCIGRGISSLAMKNGIMNFYTI